MPATSSGRGAPSNPVSTRFGLADRASDDDWRDQRETVDGDAPRPATVVTVEKPKRAITRNRSPDIPFDRSVNAYRGCEHGCIYCFARPSHAFHDLSPGLDFETRLFAKPDAPALLRRELAASSYVCAPIALGTNTDPYQPIERDWRITRGILDLLAECRHPVTITTKSDRVLRDLDLLTGMAADGLAAVMLSVTTLDPGLARSLEPRAAAPHRRLAAIRALSQAGIPVFLSLSPLIPAINDHEIEAIVAAGAEAGARGIMAMPLRLPYEVAPLFRQWLAIHRPERAARVMHHVTDMRGGRDNDPGFFTRFRPQGAYWALLRQRVDKAAARHGLSRDRLSLDTTRFRPPSDQLSLF